MINILYFYINITIIYIHTRDFWLVDYLPLLIHLLNLFFHLTPVNLSSILTISLTADGGS